MADMSNPIDKPSALAMELLDEEVQITLSFGSCDEAEAAYERMAAALRAGTGFRMGGGKPLHLEETGGEQ